MAERRTPARSSRSNSRPTAEAARPTPRAISRTCPRAPSRLKKYRRISLRREDRPKTSTSNTYVCTRNRLQSKARLVRRPWAAWILTLSRPATGSSSRSYVLLADHRASPGPTVRPGELPSRVRSRLLSSNLQRALCMFVSSHVGSDTILVRSVASWAGCSIRAWSCRNGSGDRELIVPPRPFSRATFNDCLNECLRLQPKDNRRWRATRNRSHGGPQALCSPLLHAAARHRADAREMPSRVRKHDPADDALDVEFVTLIGHRDAAKLRLAHDIQQPKQARSPLPELPPDGLLRGDSSSGDPRVQRVSRFPVEYEGCFAVSRQCDEARLPAESERDVERRYGHGPAFRFAGPLPRLGVERFDRRGGFVDHGLHLGDNRDVHARRRGTIPFAQHAATIARPPATPAGTWYQAA